MEWISPQLLKQDSNTQTSLVQRSKGRDSSFLATSGNMWHLIICMYEQQFEKGKTIQKMEEEMPRLKQLPPRRQWKPNKCAAGGTGFWRRQGGKQGMLQCKTIVVLFNSACSGGSKSFDLGIPQLQQDFWHHYYLPKKSWSSSSDDKNSLWFILTTVHRVNIGKPVEEWFPPVIMMLDALR